MRAHALCHRVPTPARGPPPGHARTEAMLCGG
jgi:hypothetical protein